MERDKERARAILAARGEFAIWRIAANPLIRPVRCHETQNLAPDPMSDASVSGLDYSRTLYLPKTDFPMRAGLPQKEPEILARWARENLYRALRESGKGRPKFVLHDGPPYANGNVHIGTALNKTLKDIVVRSHQMTGRESNYVPGWDCHGLPIEWKVEEEFYTSKGKTEARLLGFASHHRVPRECRAYAEHWLSVQREEFKRLGVVGDWDHPYTTMSYPAEAQIAREIFKFVANGLLYRGSKPVMWSVVEKTALAEAEVEYEDHISDTITWRSRSHPMTLRCSSGPRRPGPFPATARSPSPAGSPMGATGWRMRRQTIGRGPEPPISSHNRLPRAFFAPRKLARSSSLARSQATRWRRWSASTHCVASDMALPFLCSTATT